MYKLRKATQLCIEDFVTKVIHWAPRALTAYEKSALAYALFTILRNQEFFWECSSRSTEDENIDKNRFVFQMTDSDAHGSLCINEFFDLAQAIGEYLKLEISIFDEIYDVSENPTFALFLDLVFLFHQWEKNYANELVIQKAMADDDDLDF